MKISVIGYTGAGKSTLTKAISSKFNIPLLYLDTIRFNENWDFKTIDEITKTLQSFLENNDSWVIDGNYTHYLLKERLDQSDLIIFLDFNRFNCLFRCIKRKIQYNGKVRESMAPGCVEKLDFDYVKWVLFRGRTWKTKSHYIRIMNLYKDKLIKATNQKELNKIYEALNKDILFSLVKKEESLNNQIK